MMNPKLAYMCQTEQENKHATNGVITDFYFIVPIKHMKCFLVRSSLVSRPFNKVSSLQMQSKLAAQHYSYNAF